MTVARERRDQRRALGGGDVLALVDVAGAAAPKRASGPPKVYAPRTGKTTAADVAGGGGTWTVSRPRPDAVAVRRRRWPESSIARSVTAYSPAGSSPAVGVQTCS